MTAYQQWLHRQYRERLEAKLSNGLHSSRPDFVKIISASINVVFVVIVIFMWYQIRKMSETISSYQNVQVPHSLEIEKLVNQVRDELNTANENRKSQGKPIQYRVKGFDLELTFALQRTGSSNGDLRYSLVTLGNQFQVSNEATQKMIIHLDTAGREHGEAKAGQKYIVTPMPEPG